MSKKFIFTLCIVMTFGQNFAMRHEVTFIKNALNNMAIVGFLCSLSDSAVNEITKDLNSSYAQKNILEVGAGIGNISEQIETKMGLNSNLDLVERLSDNCSVLRKKFCGCRVTVHEADFLQWKPNNNKKYDIIVSTVPHISRGHKFTKEAFSKYNDLCKRTGKLIYVQLAAIHYVKSCSDDYQKTQEILEKNYDESKLVWWNAPVPVRIYTKNMAGN